MKGSVIKQLPLDLYVSHSADRGAGTKWFVVEGSPIEEQVTSLLEAGRTVYKIKAKPALTKRLARKRPIELRPANIAPRRRRRPVESR